ncbi:hypothetical protein GQ42DRAFT_109968, partial [Ramicandelaber brevisporus]
SSSGKAIALRCIFSHSDSGVVIGRKGANIISIRSNTKAQIDMVSNPNKQDLCDRILVINGTSSDVGDVAFHLGNLFLEAYANNESKEAPLSIMIPKPSQNQPAADLSPMFTLRVLVPTKCCGALIGRGGERVTEIRNRSNCIISTSDQPLPNSQERVLMISGKPEGVMDAVTQVCDILSSDSQINDYRTCMPGSPEAVSMRSQSEVVTNPDGSCTKHITLAYGEAGAIIGKGGNHVNEIKAQSGANLQFNETSPGAVTRVVTISGTPDAVASASFMVFNKLD